MASMNILRTSEGRIHYCQERLPHPRPLVIVSTGGWYSKLGTNHQQEQRADNNKKKFISKTCDTEGEMLKRQTPNTILPGAYLW
jgi:hypothetical protein